MRAYAGIGSRKAPDDVLRLASQLAGRLRDAGWTLRTGHAEGMDQAFEAGAGERAEVYLPWPGFNANVPIAADVSLDRPTSAAMNLAPLFHPAWSRTSQGARKLHARNVHQVLGRDCRVEDKVAFVVCWTPDGSGGGGTGQALRIAWRYGVPCFDLARADDRTRVEVFAAGD